jgi:sRNA-binding carbon storage regulator CsrA
MALVLSRFVDETVLIGDDIEVVVIAIERQKQGNKENCTRCGKPEAKPGTVSPETCNCTFARLAITAPRSMSIDRLEIRRDKLLRGSRRSRTGGKSRSKAGRPSRGR